MIELVKPDFIAGDEKKFYYFIGKITDKDKVALISHTDLDGVASAKITNEVINPNLLKFVNYKDLNLDLVGELKKENIQKVIFTDLFFKYAEILNEIVKFAEILIVDHHTFETDFNSDRITFLNSNGFCATYLCYYLFSKLQNIEKLDWLAACASISDFCYAKNQEWVKEIYKKYGDEFEIENDFVRKKGKMWDLQYTLSLFLVYFDDNLKEAYNKINPEILKTSELSIYSSKVLKEIEECLKKFEDEKTEFNGRYFWQFNPHYHIKSIVVNDISSVYINKTIIICAIDKKYYLISARRQDGKIDMNKLLQNLVFGFNDSSAGGHFKAAGGYILYKDKEEFLKRLKNYLNDLSNE